MAESLKNLLSHSPGPHILPALLECDFARLGEVAKEAETAGARVLHLDIMDGHFVPNLTYGLPVVRSLNQATPLFLDAHLMVVHPEHYVDSFVHAGCDVITIHIEAVPDPRPLLAHIRRLGALAGLALDPHTPLDVVKPFLDACDLVLPMSVKPGFGGQKFDPVALDKLRWLKQHGPKDRILESDGGLNGDTLPKVAEAGAQLLVVGSALYRAKDFSTEFAALSRKIQPQRHRDTEKTSEV
jgi:ribulose-phosphate 3-epimerase